MVRTIFWSYERGSWPYDLMVIGILVFVLLTPRKWFHDQAQTKGSEDAGIHLVSQNADGRTKTFRLDAQLLAPRKRTDKVNPELEREIHDVLGQNVDDLRERTFQIVEINPVRADDGSIQSYDVTVHP
ncbi:MAG TPA: hypothetical protein VMH00_06420 [Candidatus Limnocylindrales bacterium]|nr:hypothetical protein [Candidatus Limnocylindrales bacterium]